MDEYERVEQMWKTSNDEYLKFERIENRRASSPDLHAFLLLDELFPNPNGKHFAMVSAAEHDEIYLRVAWEDIRELTEEQVIDLQRCGVRYDSQYNSLCMFA